MRRAWLMWGAALAAVAATSAYGQTFKPKRTVAIPLIAEPVADDQMAEHTVAVGETFFIQRLTATRSATLSQDVQVPLLIGSIAMPKGSRLIRAVTADGGELWCGVHKEGVLLGAKNASRQWVCFEDVDRDQAFDVAYIPPPNPGAFLPTFNEVSHPRAVKASYAEDAADGRLYYETGFAHEKSFNLTNLAFINEKVREGGDEAWSSPGSNAWGVIAASGVVRTKSPLPQQLNIDRGVFTVTAIDGDRLTIRPDGARTGTVAYQLHSCRLNGAVCR